MPALDRDGQISRFAYGEFAIVQATDMQGRLLTDRSLMTARQNAAKAPNIIRRPSRVIAVPKAQKPRPDMQPTVSSTSLNSSDMVYDTAPGQDPFTSPLGRSVLLRIRVSAGADVRFTTTISVYVSILDYADTQLPRHVFRRSDRCSGQEKATSTAFCGMGAMPRRFQLGSTTRSDCRKSAGQDGSRAGQAPVGGGTWSQDRR